MKRANLHLSVLVAVAGVVGGAGCSGDLDSGATLWTVTIESPVTDGRVPFCPALISEADGLALDGTFDAAGTVQTSVTGQQDAEDGEDNLWFVSGLTSADGFTPVSQTWNQLFNQGMQFDVGPIGSIYDDNGPVKLTWGQQNSTILVTPPPQTGITMTRTLVGGAKKDDDKVELSYLYDFDCEKVTVTDQQAVEHSCDCVDQTLTFTLDGSP